MIDFDYMIADMFSNRNLNPIVTDSFFRGRMQNISLLSISQFYFAMPKNTRLNATFYYYWTL